MDDIAERVNLEIFRFYLSPTKARQQQRDDHQPNETAPKQNLKCA